MHPLDSADLANVIGAIESVGPAAALQSGMILLAGLVLVALLRRASAGTRHLVVASAQVVAVSIPVLAFIMPALPVVPRNTLVGTYSQAQVLGPERPFMGDRGPAGARLHADSAFFQTERAAAQDDPMGEAPVAAAGASEKPAAVQEENEAAAEPSISPTPVASEYSTPIAGILVSIWLVGVLILTLRLLTASVALYRLRRTKSIPVSDDLARLFQRMQQEIAPGVACRWIVSQNGCMPTVWGVFRPVVLLPEWITREPAERLSAVLRHELAHVRRRDPLWRLLGQLCAIVHWYNPLAWLALHRASLLAEQACDDDLLRAGTKASDYAEHLLHVTGLAGRESRRTLAIAMARPSSLRRRVAAMLDEHVDRSSPSRWKVAALALIAVCLTIPVTFAQPRQVHDDSPSIAPSTEANEETTVKAQPAPKPAGQAKPTGPMLNGSRRVAGYPVVVGRVLDESGRPAAGVDVSRNWRVHQGEMIPSGGWAITDADGRFELPLTWGLPVTFLAADKERRRGALVVLDKSENDSKDLVGKLEEEIEYEVEIHLEPLVDVRGSYSTLSGTRRPHDVHTRVKLNPDPQEIAEARAAPFLLDGPVIVDGRGSPFFSFRLAKGKYALAAHSWGFDEVIREIDLTGRVEPLELTDLEMPLTRRASLYGKPAPEWTITDARGLPKSAKLSDYRGKWVLLTFWGHWNAHYIDQMKNLFRFSDQHRADRDKYEIITIYHDGKYDQVQTIAELSKQMPNSLKKWKRDSFPYPIIIDTTHKTVRQYGVDYYISSPFVIDPKGIVQRSHQTEWLSKKLSGGEPEEPKIFLSEKPGAPQKPAQIKPSRTEGIVFDRFVAVNRHTDDVDDVAFMPDGKEFVTVCCDGTIRFWDLETLTETRRILYPRYFGRKDLCIPLDGRYVGGQFGREGGFKFPRLWTADSGFQDFVSWYDSSLYHGATDISPDGTKLASYSSRIEDEDNPKWLQYVRIFDLRRQKVLHVLDVHGDRIDDVGSGSDLKFSPDGRFLATGGYKGRAVQLWNVESGEKTWELRPRNATSVSSLSFSPEGHRLAVTVVISRSYRHLEILSTATGKSIRTFRNAGRKPYFVRYSPTGRYLAIADGTIRIWDTGTERIVGTLVGHPTGLGPRALAWSPDSRYLVTGGGVEHQPGEVLLWDLAGAGIVEAE